MTLIVEPEAQREWNDEREPGVGLRFNSVVWEHLKTLAAHPERFPLSGRLAQKAKINGWPCSIFFVADKTQRQIKILAVWHAKLKRCHHNRSEWVAVGREGDQRTGNPLNISYMIGFAR